MAVLRRIIQAVAVLVAALALAALATATLRTGPAPSVEFLAVPSAIGPSAPVRVVARAGGRGLAGLRLELEQKGKVQVVARREHRPAPAWNPLGAATRQDEIQADVGHRAVSGLTEGEATLRVVAERAPTWLLAPAPVVAERKLVVRITPPTLAVLSSQHYVMQGGSGVVVYRVGASAARDFVTAGEWRFPGAPLPGGAPGERVALFGVPWDVSEPTTLRVVAEDDAGNAASATFVDRFTRHPPTSDRIALDDAFLSKVVPEIREHTPSLAEKGSLLDDYLEINRELRAANAAELRELAARSAPRFLWSEPFLPLRNGKVMSTFADQRTYVYSGREVDRQTHLGFDLASTAKSEVQASNSGTVVRASYFGIYGNSVLIDHGLGLMTLSAHLSSIDVKEGQQVERGAVLGRTGATGLAGGDHLHFTTLVHGLPVNPIEWWDGKWIKDRVSSKLAR
jgi:murein DD-endopeptidase MepM/ murein hydrolase activator NlpD